MNATENSVYDGNCLVCGNTEDIPEALKDKWICEDCVEEKQREYEGELENESRCC